VISPLGEPGLVLVAAIAENGVIGRDGALPWRLRSDLRRFRELTLGHPVVMGRKTYGSIGKPLPGRTNIVITRDGGFTARGVVTATNLDAALAAARGDARRRGVAEIMIIGGADLYGQTIDGAIRLEVTRVHASPTGDSIFPPIDRDRWRELGRIEHPAGPDDDAPFATLCYERIAR
jgi:dihydrofolate reductase